MTSLKNMNAAPRILSAFGIILLITLGIGSLAVIGLNHEHDRLSALYHQDMIAGLQVDDISIARAMNGRAVRDAMLHINDSKTVAQDEAVSMAQIQKIRTDAEMAQQSAAADEKDQYQIILRDLPAYEAGHRQMYERIKAHDLPGVEALLSSVTDAAKPLFDAAAKAIELKRTHAEEKFNASATAYHEALWTVIAAVSLAVLLGGFLGVFIARGFSRPLGKAVEALQALAAGNLTAQLALHSDDEVGRMAVALNRAIESLRATMMQVADAASNTSAASQQLAASSEAIAAGAQEQAASLEETSASLEEISASVRESASNAANARELASGSGNSGAGRDGMNAVAAMEEISASSAKISDIIATVDEIAFQTNLLAVNAAVEAARAGEEGRGFAVVASEVRSLAQRSSDAAKQIKSLIQDSLRKVDRGSELVERVTQLVAQIANTSAEQSAAVDQVSTAMAQMDQVTQSNSAQTEELSATAEAMSGQANQLLELVSKFNLGRASAAHGAIPVFQLDRRKSAVDAAAMRVGRAASPVRPGEKKRVAAPVSVPAVPSLVTADGADSSFEEF